MPLLSSDQTPNCTITGCVIATGMPLIVNVPEVLIDAMHPVASPGADCRMIRFLIGQSVNGA